MFLDLVSTITGGILVIVGEGVAIGLIVLWALMASEKKADKQTEGKKVPCPYIDGLNCSEKRPEWYKHGGKMGEHFRKHV